MTDELAKLGRPSGAVTNVYVATVTAVDGHLITVDPHDGDQVDEVPWYGTTPLIGDELVLLLCNGNLIAISAGRPT